MNSVEPELLPERGLPVHDPVADLMRPDLDWFDEEAFRGVEERRERETAQARKDLAKPDWVPKDTPQDKAADEPGAGESARPAQASQSQAAASPSTAAPSGQGQQDAPAAKTVAKSAFTTDALETPPEAVSKRYLQAGNRYFLRDGSQQLAFEDRGARMVTAHNRPDVAESLAEMALAKGWSNIRVKGHEEFRREVWLQAAVRGLGVTGYTPSDVDRARLEELMAERMTNRVEQVDERGKESTKAANLPPAPGETKAAGEPKAPSAAAGLAGALVEHGAAPYRNEKNGSPSYFVTYRDAGGTDKTVWGVDLGRAMKESGAKRGDAITLENLGRQPVTVNEPVLDQDGKVIGTQPKETERNVWDVTRARPEQTVPSDTDAPKEQEAKPAVDAKRPAKESGNPSPVEAAPNAPPQPARQQPAAEPSGSAPAAPAHSEPAVPMPERSLALPIDLKGRSPESEFRGELVAHGMAPYQNREGAQRTYFATLRNEKGGNLTVWGADLERAIAGSGAQAGDRIMLSNYGRHRVTVPVPMADSLGTVTDIQPREIERYIWNTTVEARAPRPAPPPLVPEDPQRALHQAVVAETMRELGYSEKSIAKAQAKVDTVVDRLSEQGVTIPAPRVFDPAGRAQQPRSRGNVPSTGKEPERTLQQQPASPGLPSR
ncbi:hypothetical protein WK76_25060 [Burkholderia ubonensis]|nr:hypothetical protein WK76_25060 [Burkholderia ubonensis]